MTTDQLRRKLAQRLAEARGLQQLQSQLKNNEKISTATIPPAPQKDASPLSNAQERMWFLHKLDPTASAYNVCVLWHLHGNLDSNALQKSAERITQRHSIFRTAYHTDNNGNAYQKILPYMPPEWSTDNIENFSAAEKIGQLTKIAQHASTAPFDLGSRSPLRLILVKLDTLHHVLVMVGQHIVWDGPSFGIFSRELANGYNLYLHNQPDQFAPPQLQYIDFAYWHRQQWDADSEKRATELAFWKKQLTPLPEPLDFPKDFEHGAKEDETGEWYTESLDKNSTSGLLQLAAQEQLTPFEVVIAAIALLMTRLARSTEVTIGTVASHRNLPELNDAIGNFGNVVPLRLSVSGNWSFRNLLQHCAERCRSAFAHSDIPFEHLLDHLNITRGATRNQLLDTMVTFLSHGMDAPALNGLDVHWKKHFNGTSQIDLSFDALLQDGNLQLQATWRRSIYRSETVPNHLRRLARLLKACVASPDTLLAEHSLLLPDEHIRLTRMWGSRTALAADANTLVACFENTVRKYPDAIAISDIQRCKGKVADRQSGISFSTLNVRANVLARWLVSQGVGPEDRVAIALPRRPEWFVAMLAILKAGAAFVPIDPAYPPDYINRVINLSQPTLIFIESVDPSLLQDTNQNISVSLSDAEQEARQLELTNNNLSDLERHQPLRPAHPLCIVFTSGSSGEPKGVVVPHSAFVNLLSSHREDLYQEAYRHKGEKRLRIGHAWSFAFDAAWQPTLWMFDGHELHLFDIDIMQDPIALAREIILRKLDFIELTPGMLDEVLPWLQSGLTEAGGQQLPPHIPTILAFGGESVKQALWKRLTALGNTCGFNLYGPTEACVDSMISKADANEPPNIGGPVAGAQIYVLDTCLQLAPPGVPGELAIAGEGLARGYLKRGDLTAKQFVANPHGGSGSRLYRTGDRVRWLPNGILEYIGRIDEQVKIRGFRVEPLEVEATVEKIVQRPCAVVARRSNSGTMQLLCFVENDATADNAIIDSEALLQLCNAALPSHLVPKYIILLTRLPRLPNGKINRRDLVMPEGLDSVPGRSPRTPLEQQLCQLMAEVLVREQINIDDGFFELGGDSISVIKLVSLARRDGITITARQVFDTRCVARLAPLLESIQANESTNTPRMVHDNADIGLAPPTPLMARYLSLGLPLQRFAQIVALPLPSAISEIQLQTLLSTLVQRHSMLRARLVTHNDTPLLDIPPVADINIPLQSFQLTSTDSTPQQNNFPAIQPSVLARRLCNQLDISQGVMLAAALVQRENNECDLWLAINHLVIDASSWHILANDLALAHMAQERGDSMELPPVPTAWRTWSETLPRPLQQGGITQNIIHGNLASAVQKSWLLPLHKTLCPVAAAARRLGLPISNLLPALVALAAIRTGLLSTGETIILAVEHHGREPNSPVQDLSRTLGWFAKEIVINLQTTALPIDDVISEQTLISLMHQWCGAIAQTGASVHEEDSEYPAANRNQSPANNWLLGFNFLGEIATSNKREAWVPQPRLDLLIDACGDHWPLLNNLDVSAYYTHLNGSRILQFDALGPAADIDDATLERLFAELQKLAISLSRINETVGCQALTNNVQLQEVTPLQYEMLRQCAGDTDPWTTQMELHLVSTPTQPLSAKSLQQSASQLLARHEALRAGFLINSATTFIPDTLETDWQSLDWRNIPAEQQESLLNTLREKWHQHHFQLDTPPLLRFMAIHQSEDNWTLLINSHHLLLDGWSVPRVLNEWLGGACGLIFNEQPVLGWNNYLGWLQAQDRTTTWRFWNKTLQGITAPTLLCPNRTNRLPSTDLRDALSPSQSKLLLESVKKAGVSSAALYQLAWAKTLAEETRQCDIIFGLFDSGRTAPVEGLSSLVGLVTQLVPLRIDARSSLTVEAQLRELQARQFEWQALLPIRLDNLDATHRFGELFDTLLVVENALDAEAKMEAPTTVDANRMTAAPVYPLTMLREQRWQDSIGQVAGLFIYPGTQVDLRLCFDPESINNDRAQRLLAIFKVNLQELIKNLGSDAEPELANTLPESILPAETDHE